MAKNLIEEFIEAIKPDDKQTDNTYAAEVSRIDKDGTVWVYVAGSDRETPTALTSSEVNRGDNVNVEWRNNKLYIAGNVSNPSAGSIRVNAIEQAAQVANQAAQSAVADAGIARSAAEQAQAAVAEIEDDVTGLNTRLSTAEGNITTIEGNISTLQSDVSTAQGNITTIQGNISTINGQISDINSDIDDIEGDVSGLTTRVGTAEGKVTTLEGEVSTLDTNVSNLSGRVTTAEGNITAVEGDITTLQGRVSDAEETVDGTLRELSVAQDVIGTINWITNHGTMTNQTGQTFDANQVYFIVDPNGDYNIGGTHYSVVSEPVASDINNYYLLSISESVQNYVATHIVVDSEGLWIIPDSGGNKVLIATGQGTTYTSAGTYIIDGNDILASFTSSGSLIGKVGDQRIRQTSSGLEFIDENGTVTALITLENNKAIIRNTFTTVEAVIGTGFSVVGSQGEILAVDWSGDVQLALDTTASSGTDDYTIYNSLVHLGWTDSIV